MNNRHPVPRHHRSLYHILFNHHRLVKTIICLLLAPLHQSNSYNLSRQPFPTSRAKGPSLPVAEMEKTKQQAALPRVHSMRKSNIVLDLGLAIPRRGSGSEAIERANLRHKHNTSETEPRDPRSGVHVYVRLFVYIAPGLAAQVLGHNADGRAQSNLRIVFRASHSYARGSEAAAVSCVVDFTGGVGRSRRGSM